MSLDTRATLPNAIWMRLTRYLERISEFSIAHTKCFIDNSRSYTSIFRDRENIIPLVLRYSIVRSIETSIAGNPPPETKTLRYTTPYHLYKI